MCNPRKGDFSEIYLGKQAVAMTLFGLASYPNKYHIVENGIFKQGMILDSRNLG